MEVRSIGVCVVNDINESIEEGIIKNFLELKIMVFRLQKDRFRVESSIGSYLVRIVEIGEFYVYSEYFKNNRRESTIVYKEIVIGKKQWVGRFQEIFLKC